MYQVFQFLRHRLTAKGKHGVHSPFVYEFVTRILPHKPSPIGDKIEGLRRLQRKDATVVEIDDFGAGYGGHAKPLIQKTIGQVVRSSARRRTEGELLHRMVQRYQPKQILELGTNLGYASMYLSGALSPEGELVSLEGSKQLSKLAAANLASIGLPATLVVGEFSEILNQKLDWNRLRPDFVLMDGNHRKEATLGYLEFLLPRLATGAILVLDDIYWSRGMTEAWRLIVAHERVTVSLDLFDLGICFLDRPQAKEHFKIR